MAGPGVSVGSGEFGSGDALSVMQRGGISLEQLLYELVRSSEFQTLAAQAAGTSDVATALAARFPVATSDIATSAVSTGKLATGAVTAAKLGSDVPAAIAASSALTGAFAPGGTAGAAAAADVAALSSSKASKSANLADLTDPAAGRTSLGLGTAATKNTGTTTGSVAAGDDTRITGAAQKSANLSDVNPATSRSNLGLGAAAVMSTAQIAADAALNATFVALPDLPARNVSLSSPPASGDATSALTAAIAAVAAETPSNGRMLDLQGRSLSHTGLTATATTKLTNGRLTRGSGTSPQITIPSGTALQTVERLVLDRLQLSASSAVDGNVGVLVNNHAGVTCRDVRVAGEGTGFKLVAAQFGDYYSLKAYACKVGYEITSITSQGGGNSNLLVSPQAIGNEVGMLVWNGWTTAPLHSIELLSPQFLANTLCALAVFDTTNLEVRGWAAEANGGGTPDTGTYSGKTVKKSSVYLNNSRVTFAGGMIAEASVSPCFLLEGGSKLVLRDIAGYGSPFGTLVQTDSTSSVELSGKFDCVGTVHGAERIAVDLISSQCLIAGPPAVSRSADLPNAITSPQSPAFVDTAGATLGAGGTDAQLGTYQSVTFPGSASGRARMDATLGAAALVSVHMRASVDTRLQIGLSVNVGNKYVALRAGEWVRVFWWHTGLTPGAQVLLISPTDSVGATVDMCRWQVITGTDSKALRAQVNAALAGAWNDGGTSSSVIDGGTP